MPDILPALLMVICADGYGCDEKTFPMPDWQTCLEAPAAASHSVPPMETDAQEFHVTAICTGVEAD